MEATGLPVSSTRMRETQLKESASGVANSTPREISERPDGWIAASSVRKAIMCCALQVSDMFTEQTESERFFLGAITVKDSNAPWPVTLQLQDSDAEFKTDSGADTSVISQRTKH